jgi:hypothetical protein
MHPRHHRHRLQEEFAADYTAGGAQYLLGALLALDARRLQAWLALPLDLDGDVPKQVRGLVVLVLVLVLAMMPEPCCRRRRARQPPQATPTHLPSPALAHTHHPPAP